MTALSVSPKRIQRKRTKGWKMPEGAVYVGRPTIFGNPVKVSAACPAATAVKAYRKLLQAPQTKLLDLMRGDDGKPNLWGGLNVIMWREAVKRALPELRGKDLACFCPLDQPCHADVLIELANKVKP